MNNRVIKWGAVVMASVLAIGIGFKFLPIAAHHEEEKEGEDEEQSIRNAITQGDAQTVTVAGAELRVVFKKGELDLPKKTILEWVKNDASAVATYFGGFPVKQLGLLLVPQAGERTIEQGVTYGDGMPVMAVGIGQSVDRNVLSKDWVLVHEMVHLAFPLVAREHHWIEEGMATYVEPIARVQAGQLSDETMWHDVLRDIHSGLPAAGDKGLDNTPTWGRTYWGGALFCLLADVRIRQQTNNQKGLQQALQAINHETGGMVTEYDLGQVLAMGDKATNTTVLTDLYGEMANKPVTPDMEALWNDLGISMRENSVHFDDTAKLAAIRMAITQAPAEAEVANRP